MCAGGIGSSKLMGQVQSTDTVYVLVEKMPEFPGGQGALFKFLAETVKYPFLAQERGIEGRVICQFVVNKDGTITDVEVVRSGGDPLLDNEAIRVLQSMPNWNPGEQDGEPVRVRYTVPINFVIQNASLTKNITVSNRVIENYITRTYNDKDVQESRAVISAAKDKDTLACEPMPITNDVLTYKHDTIRNAMNWLYMIPRQDSRTDYYAVISKKEGRTESNIYDRNTSELVQTEQYKSEGDFQTDGVQTYYKNGKVYYMEKFRNGVLVEVIFLSENGTPLLCSSFQEASWDEWFVSRGRSYQNFGVKLVLRQQLRYYANGKLKSQCIYSLDENRQNKCTSKYFTQEGATAKFKETNARKVLQEYMNKHFHYEPIKNGVNDWVRFYAEIPLMVTIDSTGFISHVVLEGKIQYYTEGIAGREVILNYNGYDKVLSKTRFKDNSSLVTESEKYSRLQEKEIIKFISTLENSQIQCVPTKIGDVPQSETISIVLTRDCLKKYHTK